MRKTKAKFRWLALLLAMVSLFGVLAIPASADYYYAMKVSVYYKDESGKTLAPTYTTTVNATTTTLSVPSPAVSGYLGGNEQSTHEYVSKLLGRETIDTNSYGRTDGLRGNFSTNFQVAGRELLTPDEVRMLDNRYAIAFIRGESPVYDLKYDILSHPKIAEGRDGGAEAYVHGRRDDAPEIVLVHAEDYGVRAAELPRMEEIIGEFYPNLAAYDENETANLCAFLKGGKTE